MNMDQSLVAQAIAAVAQQQSGLLLIQLPPGLDSSIQEVLVATANRLRPNPGGPPYAILIDDELETSDEWVPRVSRANVIQYRKGDRLAVITGGGVDLASFDGSYKQALGPAFPAQTSSLLTLDQLSAQLVETIKSQVNVALSPSEKADCVLVLGNCLRAVGEVYEESRDLTQSWNSIWYHHVDEGLERLISELEAASAGTGNQPFGELFDEIVWASMGLPHPDQGEPWTMAAVKRFVNAMEAWWSDSDQVRIALAHVKERVSWATWDLDVESFDRNRMVTGSLFRAVQKLATGVGTALDWAQMTRPIFEHPLTDSSPMRIVSVGGMELEMAGPGSPALLPLGEDLQEPSHWATEEFLIKVALHGEPPAGTSGLNVTARPDTAAYHATDVTISGSDIEIRGYVAIRKRLRVQPIRVTLGLEAEEDSGLLGQINLAAKASLTLIPSDSGLLVYPETKTGLGSGKYLGPTRPDDEETFFTHELERDRGHVIVAWGHDPQASGIQFSSGTLHPALTTGHCPAGISTELILGSITFRLSSPEGDPRFETPLSAAPLSEPFSRGEPPESAQIMTRGIYEEFLAQGDAEEELLPSLGHCIMPVEAEGPSNRSLALEEGTSVLTPAGYHDPWYRQTLHDVSQELLTSDAYERFQAVARRVLEGLQQGGAWPSKTSWRFLVDTENDLLDEYLNAYGYLVDTAKELDDFDRLWAAFPFSISVWDGDRCSAVLVSPLHPIRLAWLASVEATLEDASNEVTGLAGVVEGWAFPLLGPDASPNGRLIAIPSDSGPREIFAAWSLMVPLSVNANEALESPSRVLGQPAPGSSPSGLTASAAAAALNDFERAHPHIPSLTIDLSASMDSPRLGEVDAAVLETIRSWAKKGLRGVRVMDSLHRSGDLPREELTKLLEGNETVITWSRYKPQSSKKAIPSNIRLLQDSGAQLRAASHNVPGYQVAGRIPLRRFWNTELVEAKEAFASVTLGSTGWDAFDRAISSLESTPTRCDLGIKLANTYLTETGADWTVSGEAFLSPGALGALLSRQSTANMPTRMLWEWRPPYLQGRYGGYIERRPYVTTARVSQALETNLHRKLSGIIDDGAAVTQRVRRVFDRLGTRGLGLSSLFARGDTHESGALGFYLAYELIDRVDTGEAIDVVLPLDACDTFIEALGGFKAGNSSKRADLLLVRIRPGSVVLCPIEIKFYGADASHAAALPHPGAALNEAYGQASTTVESLQQALDRRQSSEGSADARLWDAAFATLLESGLRLAEQSNGHSSFGSTDALEEVIRAETDIRVGKPVILYFQHGDTGSDDYRAHTDVEGARGATYGCLIARPRRVFEVVENGDSSGNDLVTSLSQIVDWATAEVPTEEVIDEATSPADPTPPEHAQPHKPREAEQETRAQGDGAANPIKPARTADAPESIQGVGIRFELGNYPGGIGRGRPTLWPSNTRLNQLNIGVAGDLGTGKTQLLKAIVYQLRSAAKENQPNPLSFLIFDYKRDFQNQDFLEAVGGRVLKPYDIPLNPLAIRGEYSERAAYKVAVDFFDVLQRIYSGVGPVQRERLVDAITDLYREHDGRPPTLRQVHERYRDGAKADSVTSILSDFVYQHVFTEDPTKARSIDDLLDDNVLVVALNEFGSNQDGKNSLVALFLNEYYGYMTRQAKRPFEGVDPQLRRLNSYLLVDEAINILRYDFEVLMNILLQGREFGVGVILASQFLNHFKPAKNDWAEPLLTWFVHKVPSVSQKDLDRVGIKVDGFLAESVSSLDVHNALYKGLDEPGRIIRGTPFYELMERGQAAAAPRALEE
ncbi:hypothetical protein GCM10025789_06610 [Tessaracoccus lubricantis]|uniref:ATP-binding protein n=1 Tax=Tessaracoccus lubricantis TaxID=545543 RepID=A0ABP9F8Q2_9ACTN